MGLVFSPTVDLVLNIAMLLLQIWILWKLQMQIHLRIRAFTIFSLGIM